MNRIAIALTAASALALSACAKKAPESLPPDPVDTSTPTPSVTPTPRPREGSGAHFRARSWLADTIFFDTDSTDIDSQDADPAAQPAHTFCRYRRRGRRSRATRTSAATREYNLALGEPRANAARIPCHPWRARGAPVDHRYGKERPVATGSNESAWAQNRRAVTVVLN